MAAGSIDRRVARTRRLLQEALFELTAEKGYAAITVEDICRRADVGRSTFYTHYPDKGSLRKAVIEEHLNTVRVEGHDDYRRTFEERPLARRVSLAEHLRGQMAEP